MNFKTIISRDQVKHDFKQILEGLQAYHSQLIIHRNLKPSNILLTSLHTFKQTDFDLFSIIEKYSSEQSSHVINLRYRPPKLILR
jgi:serine/threonine protein kinase